MLFFTYPEYMGWLSLLVVEHGRWDRPGHAEPHDYG